MSIVLPKKVENEEVLARFIFSVNFKKNKAIENKNFRYNDVFIPYDGGVSLQRTNYCNENYCKEKALYITSRKYVGFLVFKKSDFNKVVEDYKENSRVDFEADIIATPLDEENNYLQKNTEIKIDSLGNPAHADLIYINPAKLDEETPNIAYRSFARKLVKVCILIIDETPELKEYTGTPFKEAI